MSQARLLVVHPDSESFTLLSSMLQSLGHRIDEATNDRTAVKLLEKTPVDLLLAAVDPTDPDALELLVYSRRKHAQIPVILLFNQPNRERVRDAFRMGASEVLKFPLPAHDLRAAVTQALQTTRSVGGSGMGMGASCGGMLLVAATPSKTGSHGLTTETYDLPNSTSRGAPRRGESAGASPERIALVGEDPVFRQTIELAETIAATRAPVLIVGERGTGKTLLARAIHSRSTRREWPLIQVNCAGQNETLLERDLFGTKPEKGVMAGLGDRQGKVSQAAGGTLLIEGVGALSAATQARLLRLLQEGSFEPVGSNQPVRSDTRLLFSSRESLSMMVEQGLFRQDLHDRIALVTLKLPPLRQRGADIERLAEHFRESWAREHHKKVQGFTPDAIDLLDRHSWPGNVLELEHVIERAVVICRGPRISPGHLMIQTNEPRLGLASNVEASRAQVLAAIRPLKEALEEPEKQIIMRALECLNWNRQETARVLDINRTTLYKKMKKYGLLLNDVEHSD